MRQHLETCGHCNRFESKKGKDIKSRISLSIGLLLLTAGVFLGVSVSNFPALLWNSTTVSGFSTLISLLLGGLAGWTLGWTRVAGAKFWVSLLCVWAATPLIIQLSAWDALWGRLSWFSALVDVQYHRWFDGWLAVVWIHGFANIPWVALLVLVGKQWFATDLEQYSLTQRSVLWTTLTVTAPRLAPLWLLAAMVVTIRVFEQFEVTDVYQVRTWAEIWYLGFSLGELDQWDLGWVPSVSQLNQIMGYPFPNSSSVSNYDPASSSVSNYDPTLLEAAKEMDAASSQWGMASMATPVLLLLGSVLVVFTVFRRFVDSAETGSLYRQSLIRSTIFSQVGLVFTIGLPCLTLLVNLIIRAGVRVEGGKTGWTILAVMEMLKYSFADYFSAGIWSLLIGLVASVIVCSFGFLLAWVGRKESWKTTLLSIAAIVLFTLPSPLVSLHCFQQLNLSEFQWVRHLAATSIFAPVVALSVKYLGLSLLLWILVLSRESKSRQDLLQLSGIPVFRKFWFFGVRRHWQTALGFGFFILVLTAGDLSTTFATVPPGMDTFPRRILGDLHAGAGAQVAAACLIQMVLIATASLLSIQFFRISQATEAD